MNVKTNLQYEDGLFTLILGAWFKYLYQVILKLSLAEEHDLL